MPARRISDDDRRRVIDHLRDAAGQGALDLQELEDRIGAVFQAKTIFDLEPITGDLPEPTAPSTPRHKVKHRRPLVMEDDEFRGHFTTYAMVMALLVVIWLSTGAGFPWPAIVAAAWGIGLGSHYQVAATHQRKRLDRARSLGISLDELEVREREEAKAKRAARRAKRRGDRRERLAEHQHERHEQLGLPGAPRVPPLVGEEATTRRFVAAMFVDVVSSTELNETLGDEGWARVRDRHRELLRECFESGRGQEVSVAGDGVLARFDHPADAARCAIEIQRRLDRQRSDTGFAPSVRIGIHSGDVVAEGDDVIGQVVNLASRVTGAAEPDEILVTEHVADHLPAPLVTDGRGIHTLKGVSRPRHLLALRWS